jgi:hypothetical protein
MGIAVAGEFLLSAEGFHYTLTIMPPCDWDWDNVRCTNPKDKFNLPRVEWCNDDSGCKSIIWKGDQGKIVQADPRVTVQCTASSCTVALPRNIAIKTSFGLNYSTGNTMMNVQVEQRKGSVGRGSQCGHCGNFNGDQQDDGAYLYERGGLLKDEAGDGGLCDALVCASERLLPGPRAALTQEEKAAYDKYANESMGTGFDGELSKCKNQTRLMERALRNCNAAYDKTHTSHTDGVDELFLACLLDVCLLGGSEQIAEMDAEEDQQDQEAENETLTEAPAE